MSATRASTRRGILQESHPDLAPTGAVVKAADYVESGYLVTNAESEDDGDDLAWDTTTDWEAYQEKDQAVVNSGLVQLEEAASLPDGAVVQIQLSEGTGSTAADSIGNADLSDMSNYWIPGSSYQGGYAADFRGVTDYIDLVDTSVSDTLQNYFDTETWAIAATIDNFDPTQYTQILHHQPYDSGSTEISISTSNSSTGNIDFGARNFQSTDFQIGRDISGMSGPVRIIFGTDGPGNPSFALNGTVYTNSGNTNYTSGHHHFSWGHMANPSGIGSFEGILDNMVMYDRAMDSTLASEDYQAQPWV